MQDTITGLDLNKSSIGVPSRCVKLSCPFISEALTKIFNHLLEQGIVADILIPGVMKTGSANLNF